MLAILTLIGQTILPIFLVILATGLAARLIPLRPDTLARSSVYLFMPALILESVAGTEMALGEVGALVGAAVLLLLVLAVLGGGLGRLAGYERELASTFTLTVFMMNAANFGLPVVEFAWGSAGLERGVVFIVGVSLVMNTLGVYLASRGRASVRISLRNVATNPLPYAVVAGLLLNVGEVTLPVGVGRAVHLLAVAAVPVQLVVLGLQLREVLGRPERLREQWRTVLLATTARFSLGILVGVTIASLFRFEGVTRDVFILEAAMPVGITSGILAETFGGDADFAAAAILTSTVASIFVLSALLTIL